jgi:hypothetical protein
MRERCGMELCFLSYLKSALCGGEWLASRLCRFNPGERAPGTNWKGGCASPRSGLNALQKTRFCRPAFNLVNTRAELFRFQSDLVSVWNNDTSSLYCILKKRCARYGAYLLVVRCAKTLRVSCSIELPLSFPVQDVAVPREISLPYLHEYSASRNTLHAQVLKAATEEVCTVRIQMQVPVCERVGSNGGDCTLGCDDMYCVWSGGTNVSEECFAPVFRVHLVRGLNIWVRFTHDLEPTCWRHSKEVTTCKMRSCLFRNVFTARMKSVVSDNHSDVVVNLWDPAS